MPLGVSYGVKPMNERVRCPHCNEPLKLVPIIYGYPMPEVFDQARRGEVVIGGCMVSDDPRDDPRYACAACHEPIGPSALQADRPRFQPVPLEESTRSLQADLEFQVVDEEA